MVHLWNFVFYLTFDHRWSTSEAILILVKVVISAKSRHFAVLNNEQKTQHEPYPHPPYSQTHKVWGHNSFYIFYSLCLGFLCKCSDHQRYLPTSGDTISETWVKCFFEQFRLILGRFLKEKSLRIAINWHSPADYIIVSLKWGMIWDSFNWWQF